MTKRVTKNRHRIAAAATIAVLALASVLAGCKNAVADEVATLQQEAISPKLCIAKAGGGALSSGGNLDFGPVSVGGSLGVALTVTNRGEKPLIIASNGLALAGGSGAFAVDPFSGLSLAKGASGSMGLRFSPGAAVSFSATLTIASNDGETPAFKLSLSGSGSSTSKTLTSFGFPAIPVRGSIDEPGKKVVVTVPVGTSVGNLVASFESTGAKVLIGSVTQTSGATVNSFASPVTYSIVAQDGSTADYAVTVTVQQIAPIVATGTVITGVTASGATGKLTISNTGDGSANVTASGLCWSTSPNPTIASAHSSDGGTSVGTYTSAMSGLSAGTTYYVRAYAKNAGVSDYGYGDQVSFITIPTAPAAPTTTAMGGAAGSGQLLVSWTPVAGAASYNVYANTVNSRPADAWSGGSGVAGSSCTLTGLTNYTTYYVWVVASNASGSSGPSTYSTGFVGVKAASISLSKASATFLPGSSETIIATVSPANATNSNVTWSSNAAGIATVSGGTITGGNGVGSATITAAPSDGQGGTPATFTATTKAFAANTAGPAGGILFYDGGIDSYHTKGWRYLEAASVNVGAGHTWRNANTGQNINIPGAQGIDFGTGKANTAAIIAAQGAGTYFANDCAAYSQNGYADWFMPSETEANQLLFVFTYLYYSPLVLFVSSSQLANGMGNGCYGFDCTSSMWKTMLTSYSGGSVVITRPIRQF